MTPIRIPAVYMRGGTSKGVFFLAADLPADPALRDRILLRVMGSPDPYGLQIDGMGGATSSTSKVVIVSKSPRPDADVDYLFGAVAIGQPVIDWSGNCGNLTAAVGPFAIARGLVRAAAGGEPEGTAIVRIWQANIHKHIVAHVPMRNGAVREDGEFALDGVTFPSAEIKLEFLDPGAGASRTFPAGSVLDRLEVPGLGNVAATLIDAGNPMIFVQAASLGLRGTELQADVNANPELLARAEALRAHGAVAMGLAATADEVTRLRPHTPKLILIAAPQRYTASDGKPIEAAAVDLLARTFSMGKLHHAIPGTSAVATAAAAAIPGTLVYAALNGGDASPRAHRRLRIGHPSGVVVLGAEAVENNGQWQVAKVLMSRSARRLMEGWVHLPTGPGDRA